MAIAGYIGEITFAESVKKILPHQRAFIGAGERSVALVGGQGNGKSVALCLSAILHALSEPRGFSLVGRLNMPALINSTMKTFLELCKPEWGEWKPSEKRFIWNNGHETVFWHLDTSDPRVSGHIKSMNLSAAFIDEASEVSEEIYFLIEGRVRRKGVTRRKVALTSNPAGHDWLWRHFFDPERKPALLKNNLGITASTFANIHLDQSVIDHWLATYPADWADRYIHGNFSDFSDLVFKDFNERTHSWDASKSWQCFDGSGLPPLNWKTGVGIDIGSDTEHDPWAITFFAISPQGLLFVFDEIYGRGLLIADIASQFHEKIRGRPTPDIAYDYSNRQCALELAEYNINGQPAIKEVQPGLFKVAQYMHTDPRLANPFTGMEGSPRVFIAKHCRATINDLTAYKYAKDRSGNPTGEPAHDHSHAPDSLRYFIHTYRPLPSRTIAKRVWENEKLDTLSKMYWQDVEKHAREGEVQAKERKWVRPTQCRFQKPGGVRRHAVS